MKRDPFQSLITFTIAIFVILLVITILRHGASLEESPGAFIGFMLLLCPLLTLGFIYWETRTLDRYCSRAVHPTAALAIIIPLTLQWWWGEPYLGWLWNLSALIGTLMLSFYLRRFTVRESAIIKYNGSYIRPHKGFTLPVFVAELPYIIPTEFDFTVSEPDAKEKMRTAYFTCRLMLAQGYRDTDWNQVVTLAEKGAHEALRSALRSCAAVEWQLVSLQASARVYSATTYGMTAQSLS